MDVLSLALQLKKTSAIYVLIDFIRFLYVFNGFGGPGLVPLDPDQNSVQIPIINVSVALVWTPLVPKMLFWGKSAQKRCVFCI